MKVTKLHRDPLTGLWVYKIDLPYEKATGAWSHLKATARGADELSAQIKRLRVQAGQQTRSLKCAVTYGDATAHYHESHKPNWYTKHLDSLLHTWVVDETFAARFVKLVRDMEGTYRKVWKKNDEGELVRVDFVRKVVSTDEAGNEVVTDVKREVSADYLKSLKRWAKAVLSNMCRPEAGAKRLTENPLHDMRVGRSKARRRPIQDAEDRRILEVVGNDYPWFMGALDMVRHNPIRPQDQFRLRQGVEYNRFEMSIRYMPEKTKGRTLNEVWATPFIFDEMKWYYQDCLPPLDQCDRLYARPGNKALGEDPGRWYPIKELSTVWDSIKRKAEITSELKWYDYRHRAVQYQRSLGFPDWLIMKAAGWTTDEMIGHYDPHDEAAARAYAQRLLDSTKSSTASTFPAPNRLTGGKSG